MKRRNFLKTSSSALTTTALVGLSGIIEAKTFNGQQEVVEKQVSYQSVIEEINKVNGAKQYTLSLYPNSINFFKNSSESKRAVILQIDTYDNEGERSSNIYLYEIYKVKKQKGETSMFQIRTKFQSQKEGIESIPDFLKKNLYFNINMRQSFSNSYVELLDKKKDVFLKIMPIIQSTDSEDNNCYITTACAVAKNLPDDCNELQTLRLFRDTYITQTTEGKKWIRMYYSKAPKLVKRINNYTNSSEIYEYIYQNLIKQSVALIENKKYNKAFLFYRDCVMTLDKMIE